MGRVDLVTIVMIISVLQQYIYVHYRTDRQHQSQRSRLQTDCSIALVLAAVALLPVHAVLEHAPVADPGNPGVTDTGAPPEHLPPPPVPDEASRPLLHDLHTEGACNESWLNMRGCQVWCVTIPGVWLSSLLHSTAVFLSSWKGQYTPHLSSNLSWENLSFDQIPVGFCWSSVDAHW